MDRSSVASFYDQRGDLALTSGHLRLADESLRAPYDHMENILQELFDQGSRRLLDLCCGTGIHGIRAAIFGFDVTGIDLSRRSVEAATELAKHFTPSGKARFICSDALEFLDGGEEPFDVILMSGSVYYFDTTPLLAAVRKNLRSGGTFICIETFGSNGIMNIFRRMRSMVDPDRRDQRTLNNLIRASDLPLLTIGFTSTETIYFDFLTLGCFPLKIFPKIRFNLCKLARLADYWILNRAGLRFLAFKFVFIGRV